MELYFSTTDNTSALFLIHLLQVKDAVLNIGRNIFNFTREVIFHIVLDFGESFCWWIRDHCLQTPDRE